MLEYLKKKWKYVIGIFAAILGLFFALSRSNKRKKVLEKANESHEKDNKIKQQAIDTLSQELPEIHEETIRQLDDVSKKHEEISSKISEEKKKFIKDSKKNDKLAKDIADHLGADYVKTKK